MSGIGDHEEKHAEGMILDLSLDFIFRVPGEGEIGDRFEAGGSAGLDRITLKFELMGGDWFAVGIQNLKTHGK